MSVSHAIARSSLDIKVLLDTRIRCPQVDEPHSIPLSILDNTVANFSPTGCTWIYYLPDHDMLPTDILQQSLREILRQYPVWTGRLRFVTFNPQEALADHTRRHGRLWVDFGSHDTPGVRFIVACSSTPVVSIVAQPVIQASDAPGLGAAGFPCAGFIDKNAALSPCEDDTDAPSVIIQVTIFADDAIAISIKMAHPLADAQSLLRFVSDWAAMNRSMTAKQTMPRLTAPIFDPFRLDSIAAGDINGTIVDPSLITQSHALPMHRYDWWASGGDACPTTMFPSTIIPAALITSKPFSPIGPSLPWSQWDLSASLDHNTFTFSASTVEKLHCIASGCDERISHLDALLAYVWRCIILSRDIRDDESHYLDVTLNVRSRVKPQLPETFLGSPLVLAFAGATGAHARLDLPLSLKILASSIRSTISKFTSQNISALLHELAHYNDPRRRWDACLGRNHTIVTSWLRLGVEKVDFGAGIPWLMEANMPSCDGCIQIMEAVRNGRKDKWDSEPSKQWWSGGIIVSVDLASETMAKFAVCMTEAIP